MNGALLGDFLQSTDPKKALGKYQKALAITRRLVEAQPRDPRILRDLAVSLNKVASMLKYSNLGQALKHYRESLAIRRVLIDVFPDDFQLRRDYVVSLGNLAGMLRNSEA